MNMFGQFPLNDGMHIAFIDVDLKKLSICTNQIENAFTLHDFATRNGFEYSIGKDSFTIILPIDREAIKELRDDKLQSGN